MNLIQRSRAGTRKLIAALVVCSLLPCLGFTQVSLELDQEAIENHLATLESSQTDAIALYEQALGYVGRALTYASRRTEFEELIAAAPERGRMIQQRIDGFDGEFNPDKALEGFTAEELQPRLALARAELAELKVRQGQISERANIRPPALISEELGSAQERLAKLAPGQTASADIENPQQTLLKAQQQALDAEVRLLATELQSVQIRTNLSTLESAEIEVLIDRQNQLLRALENKIETTRISLPLNITLGEGDPLYPLAQEVAAADRTVLDQLSETYRQQRTIRQQLEELAARERLITQRNGVVDRLATSVDNSESSAAILLRYWAEIESIATDIQVNVNAAIGDATALGLDLEEATARMVNAPAYLNSKLGEYGVPRNQASARSEAAVLDMLRAHRETLRSAAAANAEHLESLHRLTTETAKVNLAQVAYKEKMGALVQWIPSHAGLWEITRSALTEELSSMNAAAAASYRPSLSMQLSVVLMLAIGLFAFRRFLIASASRDDARVNRPRSDRMSITLRALGYVALAASPLPLLVFAGTRLFFPDNGTIQSVGNHAALMLLSLLFYRHLTEERGIASIHFQWTSGTTARMNKELTFVLRRWFPVAAVTALAFIFSHSDSDAFVARLLLVLGLMLLLFTVANTGIRLYRSEPEGWFSQWPNRGRVALIFVLIALIATVVLGQTYTVLQLLQSLSLSILLTASSVLVYSILVRWLRMTRRRLRFLELTSQQRDGETAGDATVTNEDVASLVGVSTETQELLNVATFAGFATALFLIWQPLLPALGVLDEWVLWTSTTLVDSVEVVSTVTLGTILATALLLVLTFYLAKRLPALVEILLRQRTAVSPGGRYTISTVMNYAIVGTGFIYALSTLGVEWAQLQWLIAALGVGIGFGLQEIVANFISGLIILFERPIRVGDIVSVGGKDGTVTKIRIRATTIRDWDGKELLVPNKEFITSQLLNWTLSDSQTRLVIPVGIAYGSDVESALAMLKDIVIKHPRTLTEPEPLIVFEHFGDNALELSARCFMDSLDGRMQVMTELRTQINLAFEEAGIVIAFPQRDIHLDGTLTLNTPDSSPSA